MRAVRGLAEACHPGPTALVTTFATSAGLASGMGSRTAVTLALAVLLGQLSTGWCNDWWDARVDRAGQRSEKPVVKGLVSRRTVGLAAFTALTICVPVSLALGWRGGLTHLAAVGSAWSYNLLLKSTLLSALPYAFSFGLLPAFVALSLRAHPSPALGVVAASALVGVGAHLTNGVKDMDADAATGIVGMPQRLGVWAATAASTACVLVAVGVLVATRPEPAVAGLGGVALVLALVALRQARSGRAERLFALSMLASAPVVVAIVVSGGVV